MTSWHTHKTDKQIKNVQSFFTFIWIWNIWHYQVPAEHSLILCVSDNILFEFIVQSNLNDSNIFGTMEIRSRHG